MHQNENRSISYHEAKPFLAETLSYRGLTFEVYYDPLKDQFYTFYDGDQLDFGLNNYDYTKDLKKFIDLKLDCIKLFNGFRSILFYYNNAGTRDIKLVQQRRLLKVYLLDSIKLDDVLLDSENIVKYYFEKNWKK